MDGKTTISLTWFFFKINLPRNKVKINKLCILDVSEYMILSLKSENEDISIFKQKYKTIGIWYNKKKKNNIKIYILSMDLYTITIDSMSV